jgi:hypothetical protein
VMCAHVPLVHAHPKVDEAGRRLESAEFESAGRLLAEAEAASDLGREDALRLLELRALLHLALKEREDAFAALRRLAVLEPEHAFPPHSSPDLLAAFARARDAAPPPPTLRVQHELAAEGVRVSARVEGDTLGLVRGVRLWSRVAGHPWRSALANEWLVPAPTDERVSYWAEGLGIGGAPLYRSIEGRVRIPEALGADRDDEESGSSSAWLYGGVIAGAIAIAGALTAIAVVAAGGGDDTTQLSPPMVVVRR